MISLLRAGDRPRIPWKNGGGEAEDIATGPPGASWESMDWRVSRAWIAASGPFSGEKNIISSSPVAGLIAQPDSNASMKPR